MLQEQTPQGTLFISPSCCISSVGLQGSLLIVSTPRWPDGGSIPNASVVTMVRGQQFNESYAGPWNFHLAVTPIPSIHITLAKACHRSLCNLKDMGTCHPTMCLEGEESWDVCEQPQHWVIGMCIFTFLHPDCFPK